MLNKTILLLAFFLFPTVLRQDYGPLKLRWEEHYKAEPDNRSPYYALTSLIFNYAYESRLNGKQLQLSFRFTADVDRTKSWVKRSKLTNSSAAILLNHEQGHVNINYLLMRETERQLTQKKYSVQNFKREIEATSAEIYRYFDQLQLRYDAETEHGTKRSSQRWWDEFIDKSLADLK